MKIIIINGSNRKNGTTGLILNEMALHLKKFSDVDVQIFHVADFKLEYCTGCCACYRTGKCIFQDDIENLSSDIENADGIILGSPNYASNVSGQMKVIIDRGHFVIEQLLYGKYAVSVATYENYGGKDTAKVLNKLLLYSGAQISSTVLYKNPFSSNPFGNAGFKKLIQKKADRLYKDISRRHNYVLQRIKHFIIFQMGIKPFVKKKGEKYNGVIKHWKKRNIRI